VCICKSIFFYTKIIYSYINKVRTQENKKDKLDKKDNEQKVLQYKKNDEKNTNFCSKQLTKNKSDDNKARVCNMHCFDKSFLIK